MNTTQQPIALRLAEMLTADEWPGSVTLVSYVRECVAELRRQHARIAELEAQLSAIGAGGVEPLRKPAAVVADAPMVDMTPPATRRDRWMYEQGRLAERDARTPGSVAAAAPVVLPEHVTDEQIKAVFLANGFTIKDGLADLKPYVYQAARALLAGVSAPAAVADALDVERWMGIGKAIERACADLPEETEIIVSLEKDAGTVTLIDQDGNEHENFSTDYGFAGVLNEAIDAALAAQAKQKG